MQKILVVAELLFLSLGLVYGQTPSGKGGIAEHFSEQLSKHPCSIYVAPFSGPGEQITELGFWVKENLEKELAAQSCSFVAKAEVQAVIEKEVTMDAVAFHPEVAAWVGGKVGATLAVAGSVRLVQNKIEIQILLLETKTLKLAGSAVVKGARQPFHAELEKKVVQPLQAEVWGVGEFAKCSYCPSPEYSKLEKVKMPAKGMTILRAFVGADGKIRRASVVKSAGPVFDQLATIAVCRWKLIPPKRGNKPFASWSTIEVAFNFH